jgi:predicted nuclease with TOPRIM domain
MQEELQRKLDELKKEYEVGQNRLRELETEQAYVRETMLRISGAIQVLQELIDGSNKEDQDAGHTLEARAVS